MQRSFLSHLWFSAWALVLPDMSGKEISWLAHSRGHISLLDTRRTAMIVSRVRMVAGLFAILTPLWLAIDIWAFPAEIWHGLAVCRLSATAAFAFLLLALKRRNGIADAYRALAMLLAIPTLFFIYTYQHMAQFKLQGMQEAFAVGYAYLPFVMLAGLSVFPLTVMESLTFAAPMLLGQALAAYLKLPVLDWPTFAASFWLLLLITAVSTLAGVSQLAFMIVLVREAMHDKLTGCFSRRSGEELLKLQFNIARRSNSPLAVAFIDIDHFKQVNDRFGHEAGDRVLLDVAQGLLQPLRAGDVLVRWGGEEFLLLLPDSDIPAARHALLRVTGAGLGRRPDGNPVTASIGLAERLADASGDWKTLIEIADARMYEAKQAGRNRIVSGPANAGR